MCWPGNIEHFISSASGCVFKESKNINLKRHMQPHGHCSMIYKSQDTETTWVSSYGGRNWIKKCGVHLQWNGHSAIKRSCHVTPQMDLEDIILSKNESENDRPTISLICGIQNLQRKRAHRYREQIDSYQKCWVGGGPNGQRRSKGTNFQL